MRSLLALLFVVLCVSLGVGCEDSTGKPPAVAAVPTSIEITPPALTLAAGTSSDVKALVLFSDQSTKDVTSYATWTSSDTAVATVAAGKVTALKTGFATITVSGEAQSRAVYVTVTPATLVSLSLTPPAPSVAKGLTTQLVATGTFSDTTTQNLSTQVTWSSSAPNATVDATGLVTTVTAGAATISASMGAITGSTPVTVTNASLVSIEVTPSTPTVPVGLTKQMTATGIFTDNSKQDLTSQVTWASTSATIASIDATGLAHTLSLGTTTISASLMGISGKTVLMANDAVLVSIGVTPATPSVAKGLTQQFVATGVFTDALTQDLTTQVTWTSSDEANVTVSNAAGSKGRASTPGLGTATVTATLGATSGDTTLTVTPATLVSITVTPAAASKAKGLTEQFTATGVYTDASTQDLTTAVTWQSSDTNKVTISNAAGSNGLASTPATGKVTITATSGAVSGNTAFTVTAAALVSIEVTPADSSVAKGLTQKFTATGTFTDKSTALLTTTATWKSSNTGVVTISNAAGSQGVASSPATGTVTITATSGVVSGTTTFTVTPATLLSIAVTPANPSVAKGLTQQFTATGTFTDGSKPNLTTAVTWTSSNTKIAQISNAPLSQGLASTNNVGTVTITATSPTNPLISGTATLTVTPATLVSLVVSPAALTLGLAESQQYTATANYTDGPQDVTLAVTWASSDVKIATISNNVKNKGVAISDKKNTGTTQISALLGAVASNKAALTVTVTQRFVFASSVKNNGNFGGLNGADALCNARATAAGLPGNYRAWLSDATGSPSTRFVKSTVKYMLTDGTLVANDWNALIGGTIQKPISLDEFGAPAPTTSIFLQCANPNPTGGPSNAVYTNTKVDGTMFDSKNSCGNWLLQSSGNPVYGSSLASDSRWTLFCPGNSDSGCFSQTSFYCFQQ